MKKVIIVLAIGLMLVSGVAYAAVKKAEFLNVYTVELSSELLKTKNVVVYKIIDNGTVCYVNPVTNTKGNIVVSSSISCVR